MLIGPHAYTFATFATFPDPATTTTTGRQLSKQKRLQTISTGELMWETWPKSSSVHTKPKSLKVKGYQKLPALLNEAEASSLRALVLAKRPNLRWLNGNILPDVLTQYEYKSVRELCELPMRKPALHAVLRDAFRGRAYAELGFCDIQVNTSVAWHRDVLHGQLARFQTHDLWTKYRKDTYSMFRLIMYLQDHRNDSSALAVSPGTHLLRGQSTNPGSKQDVPFNGAKFVHPALGDAVLIDMRLMHRGRHKPAPWGTRVVVQLTFGAQNSSFTRDWARGDTIRRRDQMRKVQFLT